LNDIGEVGEWENGRMAHLVGRDKGEVVKRRKKKRGGDARLAHQFLQSTILIKHLSHPALLHDYQVTPRYH